MTRRARTPACRVETDLDALASRKSTGDALPYVATQPLDWPADAPPPEILSTEERERYSRFLRPADRARYAQAHVFLRRTLSLFADVLPADWRFSSNPFGRPAIAAPHDSLALDFNLSHTHDYAACVVTRAVPCGIDIERIRAVPELLGVARMQFSSGESLELESLSDEPRARRFFELWTEKEAWVKACGKGLSLPMNRIVSQIPGVTLQRYRPTPDHAMAVVLLLTPP